MVFAPDTAAALRTVVNLINSSANHEDKLDTLEALDDFLRNEGFTGSRTHDLIELAAVQSLRAELRQLWHANEAAAVDGVNRILVETRALPQLVKHDHWDWHLHATTSEEPLRDRIAAEAAMALVDVIRNNEMSRLMVCAAQDCDAVLVDLSRNRSRKFCDTGNCGNRAHVAAYRARRAASE